MPDVFDRLHALVKPPPIASYCHRSHVYSLDGVVVPGVSECLKNAALADYSQVPVGVLQAAADRGTALHEATALLDQENLDLESVDPVIQGYLLSYQLWRENARPVYRDIERWGIFDCNGLKYGGTVDRIGFLEMGAEIWVLDIKTSSKRQDWWAIQTAAYDEQQDKRRGVIHCFKDGKAAQLIEYTEDTDYSVWEACLKLEHWKRSRKSRGLTISHGYIRPCGVLAGIQLTPKMNLYGGLA